MIWGQRRHNWRRGCALVGLLLAALPGCRWLPLHRPDAGLDPRTLSRVDTNRPVDPPTIAVNDGPRQSSSSVPLPNLPLQPISAYEALAASPPTPLLDAGLERAVAFETAKDAPGLVDPAVQQTVLQEPEPLPEVLEPPPPSVAVRIIEPEPKAQPEEAWQLGMEALLKLASEQALREVETGKLGDWSAREQLLVRLAQSDGTLWRTIVDALAHAQEDAAAEQETDEPQANALAIVDLQFCRKVEGFGVYEVSTPEELRPGGTVGLYWEIEGLTSELLADGQHRTLLETTVEILLADGEAAVWTQVLGAAEDRCRRVRRDFFVNTRLTLPETLAPGDYRLRLRVVDGRARTETIRDLPFTLRP